MGHGLAAHNPLSTPLTHIEGALLKELAVDRGRLPHGDLKLRISEHHWAARHRGRFGRSPGHGRGHRTIAVSSYLSLLGVSVRATRQQLERHDSDSDVSVSHSV